jgi:ABC-type lipoprotein release transport system permease subunit
MDQRYQVAIEGTINLAKQHLKDLELIVETNSLPQMNQAKPQEVLSAVEKQQLQRVERRNIEAEFQRQRKGKRNRMLIVMMFIAAVVVLAIWVNTGST